MFFCNEHKVWFEDDCQQCTNIALKDETELNQLEGEYQRSIYSILKVNSAITLQGERLA
mgnify:FL=1